MERWQEEGEEDARREWEEARDEGRELVSWSEAGRLEDVGDPGRGEDVSGESVAGDRWPESNTQALRNAGIRCGVTVKKGRYAGKPCPNPAGQGTNHVGVGRCVMHGGAKRRGRSGGAWLMAHAFARELNVTPWEALLQAVRIAAGKVAYCEQVLAGAASDSELEGRVERIGDGPDALVVDPDTREPLGVGFRDRSWWVEKSEYWHTQLARTAKMAIDAGVAEKLVQAQVLQVQLVTRPIEAALAVLELTHEQELEVRAAMRRELQAIESENAATLEGELVEMKEEKTSG